MEGGECHPLEILLPCRPKGSLLYTVLVYSFSVTDPKICLEAPLALIYTKRAPKGAIFLAKIFQKVFKNAFLAKFLKVLAAAQKIRPN